MVQRTTFRLSARSSVFSGTSLCWCRHIVARKQICSAVKVYAEWQSPFQVHIRSVGCLQK